MNSLLEQLFALSSAYGAALNLAEGTVSDRALGGGNRLRDLRGGTDIGVRRLQKAILWFSEHWPEATDWPEAIERPKPRATEPTSVAAVR